MAPEKRRPRVVVLRCLACRAELPAAPNDVAFRCPQCGRAWEIENAALSERPSVHVAAPAAARHPILHLPYWSFAVRASAEPRERRDERTLSARDRAARMERAFVAAYAIHRPTYVGEWGLVYTRATPNWEVRSGHGPEAPGAAISAADAKKIATHYVLGEIDRAADIGALDVNVELGEPELWAIPCYHHGPGIRCPWTHAELPVAALDDFSEIRRVRDRLEA